MDENQFKLALMDLGVIDVNSLADIMNHVRCIEFNNNAAIYLDPLNETHKIEKIDYVNQLITLRSYVSGRWRPQIKPFGTIEAVIGLSDKVPEGVEGGVIEYDDGSYFIQGNSLNNQEFIMNKDGTFYKGKNGKPVSSKNYNGSLYDNIFRK